MESVSADTVAETIRRGGCVYPYPRRGEVSLNGNRRQPATAAAVRLAVAELKRWRAKRAAAAAYASVGADIATDCDGAETMSAAQLRDEIVFIADYQG